MSGTAVRPSSDKVWGDLEGFGEGGGEGGAEFVAVCVVEVEELRGV